MQDKEGGGGGVKVQYQRFSQSEAWESVCAALLDVTFVLDRCSLHIRIKSAVTIRIVLFNASHHMLVHPKTLSLLHTVT